MTRNRQNPWRVWKARSRVWICVGAIPCEKNRTTVTDGRRRQLEAMEPQGRPNLDGVRQPRREVLRDAHRQELPPRPKRRRGSGEGEPNRREPVPCGDLPAMRAQGFKASADHGPLRPVPRAKLRAAREGACGSHAGGSGERERPGVPIRHRGREKGPGA